MQGIDRREPGRRAVEAERTFTCQKQGLGSRQCDGCPHRGSVAGRTVTPPIGQLGKKNEEFLVNKKNLCIFAVLFEAIHNKDYSVVKTFRAARPSDPVALLFMLLVVDY